MPFDVHVTFVGLCLYVDGGSENPLEVLMPPTGHVTPQDEEEQCPAPAHPHGTQPAHGTGASGAAAHAHPEHFAVVLYDAEDEDGAAPTASGLKSLDLKGGELDLSGLATLDRHLHVYLRDVVDLTEVVKGRRADRGLAAARVLVGSGTARPISFQEHLRGGRWKLGNRPPEHMATNVQWIIPDVVEIAGENGEEGITLQIREADGTIREPAPTLRPGEDRCIHLQVYHTPEADLPKKDRNIPRSEETYKPGDPAKHFEFFYGLFPGVKPVIPTFVDEGSKGEKALAGTSAGGLIGCVGSMVREH